MAKALLMSGGAGGVSSDDVTASRAQVLQGYRTVTTDSDDEPIEGAMENRGYHGPDSSECWLYPAEGGYVIRLEEGFYHKDESGHKPYVIAPTALIKQAVGYKPEKTLSDTIICGEQGQIKIIDTGANNFKSNMSNNYGIDYGRGTFFIDFAHGTAYYTRGDGHPHVCIPADALGDADASSVLVGRTATSKNGVKFVGTMPDYSTGRVVFNGATFDGTLASGVAEKGFQCDGEYCAYFVANGYGYGGIGGGGMNLALDTGMPTIRGRRIGVTLLQSINLTPFRQIIIDYRANAIIQYNPFVSLNVYITKASNIRRNGVIVNGVPQDILGSILATKSNQGFQGQWVIDVSNINEHVLLSFVGRADSPPTQIFRGSMQITKIEFKN